MSEGSAEFEVVESLVAVTEGCSSRSVVEEEAAAFVVVALCIANTIYIQHQLDERRQQIQQDFSNLGN